MKASDRPSPHQVTNRPPRVCWPEPLQELLLRATILDGEAARSAWQSWRMEADFENLDGGSQRLLPETYTNLMKIGVEDPLLRRMKGVKRRTWLQNQLLFHQATTALRILQDRGMETMVTKGPALVLRHYRDVGRRPMADFDIVVRKDCAQDAIDALEENGFTLKEPAQRDRDLSLKHAVSYVNETGRQFDLHWQVLEGCSDSRVFWDGAGPVAVNETTTLAPSSTDLLFHVCIHGLRLNEVPPLRWVADAAIIMQDAAIDWDRLQYLSDKFWLRHRMREALRYLTRFDLDIPDNAIARLSARQTMYLQRWEHEFLAGSRQKSLRTQVAKIWLGYRRYEDRDKVGFSVTQFPGYLQRIWGADNLWSLPFTAIRKGARRLFVNPTD